jgi:hypothetical protein
MKTKMARRFHACQKDCAALCVARERFRLNRGRTREFKNESLTNPAKYCLILDVSCRRATRGHNEQHDLLSTTIAHDNGKPVVRQGRKAVSLWQLTF